MPKTYKQMMKEILKPKGSKKTVKVVGGGTPPKVVKI